MARVAFLLLGAYVGLALGSDAFIGATQVSLEPGRAEGILRTFDADGRIHESRMIVIDDGDTTWVQSRRSRRLDPR